jgi:nicotinamide riboside kinase
VSLIKQKIICITGPESSGKTTLANAFKNRDQITVIPEYARDYLKGLNRPYIQSDLEQIALTQLKLITSAQTPVVITDTGIEVIKIWNHEKFGFSAVIENLLKQQLKLIETYWLCKPDITWESDPLRENPYDRDRLFKDYQLLLEEHDQSFIIMEGTQENRFTTALKNFELKKNLN